MKKQAFRTVATLSFLVTLMVGSVYADSRSIRVTIPFDFTVGKTTLPAGKYTLERADWQGMLLIYNEERRPVAALTTQNIEAREAPEKTLLVFRRYGEQYFLAQVWSQGKVDGRELTPSRRERSLTRELAENGLKPEVVHIAAE